MQKTSDFLNLLGQLRMSSKHAIIDGDEYSLNEFKEYLHVERKVEKRLKEIINSSSNSGISQLILVCGNVGDGKSHILSYLNSSINDKFTIHNDATESFNPHESFAETLNKSLNNFSDVNLKNNNSKAILAINLGTLNNFLDSYADEFSLLKEFVENKGILKSDVVLKDKHDPESHFQFINFADYQLYELTASGVKSSLVSEIFHKIFDNSKENPLYIEFLKFKEELNGAAYPIVFNYEFLSNITNREIVIKLMIKAVIKSKGIVSLRSVFNFIYDIIVPVDFNNLEVEKLINKKPLTEVRNIKNLIPFYIFNNPGLSNIFSIISFEDPCKRRSEKVDDTIIKLVNSNNPKSFINDYYPSYSENNYFVKLYEECHIDTKVISSFHNRLLFFENETEYGLNDSNFDRYTEFLFGLNTGNKKIIRELYKVVISACGKWNGNPNNSNSIIVEVARKQKKYRVIQSFNPKPSSINDIEELEVEEISKFSPQLIVKFKGNNQNTIQFHIDSGLLGLLSKVNNGYRPNKLDKNSYVNFITFLNKLIESEKDNEKYSIDEVNIGKSVDYIFSLDSFGEGYSFKSTQ